MDSDRSKKVLDIGTRAIVVIAALVVLAPMIVLREDYIFTIHDYLDEWPNLLEVLRKNQLFWAFDKSMPIMDGSISTCYLYFDFGIWRLLNYFFGFVGGEIANKTLGIIFGYVSMKSLLNEAFENNKEDFLYVFRLISIAYAISPVYPIWTISFSVLPYIFLEFWRYVRKPEKIDLKHSIFYISFAFFVYFPSIGIFVMGVWALGIIFSSFAHKKLNVKMMASFGCMFVSVVIWNFNIFIYTLRGDVLNRTLWSHKHYYDSFSDGIVRWFTETVKVGLTGQYHAAPCLLILLPLCIIGFILSIYKAVRCKKVNIIKGPALLVFIMILLCAIYGANAIGLLQKILSKILPVFSGFNLGRIVYFNNVLWYLLAALLVVSLCKGKYAKNFAMVFAVMQILAIILSNGKYYDTRNNLFYSNSVSKGMVSYKEFFDEEYFSMLKEQIDYNGEGVVSVGYHPSVTMYNGFHTLDGYLCINPVSYHESFRKVVEPMLEKYPVLQEAYDTSGIRLYVYSDASRNVAPQRIASKEARELLINTDAFVDLGGKYIFSLYELSNAEELNFEMVYHNDGTNGNNSIYRTLYVYKIGFDGNSKELSEREAK